MCVKQDCQLKHLLAVLVLAAAVARIHGQGKDLPGVMRTFVPSTSFCCLTTVGEDRARDTGITVWSTSVYGGGVSSLEQWQDDLIKFTISNQHKCIILSCINGLKVTCTFYCYLNMHIFQTSSKYRKRLSFGSSSHTLFSQLEVINPHILPPCMWQALTQRLPTITTHRDLYRNTCTHNIWPEHKVSPCGK